MRNIKINLAYDGTDFHGWQIQPGLPTIQGALSAVVEKLTQSRSTICGAGRTDAGVHAAGQVANFHTESAMTPEEFQHAFNALLPPSIRVLAAEEAGPEFHARWNAVAKTYRYKIFRGRIVPPFLYRYVQHDPYPLDFAAMADAARRFEGEHDFTTFATSTGSEEDGRDRITMRTVYRSELLMKGEANSQPSGEEWIYVVRGRSFLRYMVRKLVGTLVEVGRGRLKPDDIPVLFESRDRSKCGPTMPPHGLCMEEVEYNDSRNSALPDDLQSSVRS